MANTHSIFVGTHCAYWDVDSYNNIGTAATDMDNGTFVALGAMGTDYTYTVTAATAATDYVVYTAPYAFDAETALYDDPRYFYNKSGRPMGVKRLVIGDCIEVDANCFTSEPASTDTYAEVSSVTGGKLTSSTTTTQTYKIERTGSIDIGGTAVKTWILRKMK